MLINYNCLKPTNPKKIDSKLSFTARTFLLLSCLWFTSTPKAYSLAISPLTVTEPSGELKVVNDQERLRKIKIVAYPAVFTKDDERTLKTSGFDAEEMEKSVKFSPKTVRIAGKESRYIRYSIEGEGAYYMCAESVINVQLTFRVCTLYEGDF